MPVRGENVCGDHCSIEVHVYVVWKPLKQDMSHVIGKSHVSFVKEPVHVTENNVMCSQIP